MNLAENIHVVDGSEDLAPQIASFLRDCLRDPALLERMSAGADEVTRTFLSYERLAQRTLDIAEVYRRAIGRAEGNS